MNQSYLLIFLYQGGKNMKQKTYEMLLGIQTIFMKYEIDYDKYIN